MSELDRELLSEALDLCVRARKLDAQDRANVAVAASADPDAMRELLPRCAARHNERFPDQPMESRSGTIPLWVQDQYERDLADWERRARHHLMKA